jgi:hypothetical protein
VSEPLNKDERRFWDGVAMAVAGAAVSLLKEGPGRTNPFPIAEFDGPVIAAIAANTATALLEARRKVIPRVGEGGGA